MNIFKKKNEFNTYKINCYLEQTKQVRGFAEKFAAAGTIVEVRAHDSLLKDIVRVTVTFKSKESERVIYAGMLEEFRKYRIKIEGKTISISKDTGL